MDRSSRPSHLWSNLPSAHPHPLRHFVYRRVPRHPNADRSVFTSWSIRFLPIPLMLVCASSPALWPHPAAPRFARSTASDTAGPSTGTAPPAGISPLCCLALIPLGVGILFAHTGYRVLRSIRNRSNDSPSLSFPALLLGLSHPAEPDGRSRRHARVCAPHSSSIPLGNSG